MHMLSAERDAALQQLAQCADWMNESVHLHLTKLNRLSANLV